MLAQQVARQHHSGGPQLAAASSFQIFMQLQWRAEQPVEVDARRARGFVLRQLHKVFREAGEEAVVVGHGGGRGVEVRGRCRVTPRRSTPLISFGATKIFVATTIDKVPHVLPSKRPSDYIIFKCDAECCLPRQIRWLCEAGNHHVDKLPDWQMLSLSVDEVILER